MIDNKHHAPLLPDHVVEQIRRLAGTIRACEVAPLIGAGLSQRRSLPGWDELVTRLIIAWQQWDPSLAAKTLSQDNYVQLIRFQFGNSGLAIVSYLRHCIDVLDAPEAITFGQILYGALYANPWNPETTFTPNPDHVHRHLVHLFDRPPMRIWTSNYDDLIEEAANLNGISARTLDPDRRATSAGLAIAHLHGFLAPPDRKSEHPDPGIASVILAEDDYHAVASDIVGWTNREFHRLFDEHRALILGMSLTDPNLRRALSVIRVQNRPAEPRHFAVVQSIDNADLPLKHIRPPRRQQAAQEGSKIRSWYWLQYGIELIELPDHDSVLPFLLRLRYESFGNEPGDLWREGAQAGYQSVNPWQESRQEVAQRYLRDAIRAIATQFEVPNGEIVEFGIFLIETNGRSLELVFRSGATIRAQMDPVKFSADPDAPTGVAGRVFVSGDVVRVPRSHELHDYGVEGRNPSSSPTYDGIISVPLIDWKSGGIPIGVAYVTTTTVSGRLFSLRPNTETLPGQTSLDDLYVVLSDVAMTLLQSWRS